MRVRGLAISKSAATASNSSGDLPKVDASAGPWGVAAPESAWEFEASEGAWGVGASEGPGRVAAVSKIGGVVDVPSEKIGEVASSENPRGVGAPKRVEEVAVASERFEIELRGSGMLSMICSPSPDVFVSSS